MNEIAELCANLREIADCMPPGLTRDRMQADLQTLRARLAALPGRVAAPYHASAFSKIRNRSADRS